jgi:hypothetical protein
VVGFDFTCLPTAPLGVVMALTYFGLRIPLVVEMVAALLVHARPGINSLILHRLLYRLELRVSPSPSPPPSPGPLAVIILPTPQGPAEQVRHRRSSLGFPGCETRTAGLPC